MMPNTAFGVFVAGAALWNRSRGGRRNFEWLTHGAAVFTFLLGALTLFEHLSGKALGIDALLVAGRDGSRFRQFRMSVESACTFILIGLALWPAKTRRAVLRGQLLACAAGLLPLLVLVSYLYGIRFLLTAHIGMAFHSALAFECLCLGILLLHPGRGPIATILAMAPGGHVARRLLPAAVLTPIVAGWIRWQGEILGLYSAEAGLAVYTSVNIVVLTVLIWLSANRLNRSDRERTRAEECLRESEARYRTTLDCVPQMTWTCNAGGRCDYLSRQWMEYVGEPLESQSEFCWMREIHPEDRDRIEAAWSCSVARGGTWEAEYRLRNRDGVYRWFRAIAVPQRDSGGAVTKWFGCCTDVDLLKRMEEALRESEASFRQLADAMPQIVLTAGADGRMEYFNQRWNECTGLTQTESIAGGWEVMVHPDDRERCARRWRHCVETGESYEVEFRFRRASDGAYRWHLARANPVRDASGAIERWFATCTDVEELKRAEADIKALNGSLEDRVRQRTAELASTKAQLQGVLDSATQVAIIATDAAGIVRLFNAGAERMLLYRAGELLGGSAGILHEAEESGAANFAEVYAGAARRGLPEGQEWTYVRKDGVRIDVNAVVTPILDARGAIAGYLSIATDNTERKRLRREQQAINEQLALQTRRAEQASHAKSDFLASMSHEIRTPMNSILGMADLLWETSLSAEQRHYVEVFRRAGSTLLSLINDILDLSKIESGRFELDRQPFDLREVVDETIALFGPRASEKGIGLRAVWTPPDATTWFVGDPVRLKQVLTNLVGNAVKFTASGEVVVSAGRREDGLLEITVSDTGIGIPPGKLEAIFDDFIQAESSIAQRFGGTGLGLAISRRIAEQMGGGLSVTSEFGHGSTFRFLAKLEPWEAGAAGPAPLRRDLAGKRVLLVDPEPGHRRMLLETLQSWGVVASGSAGDLPGTSCDLALVAEDRAGGRSSVEQIRKSFPDLPIATFAPDMPGGGLQRLVLSALGGAREHPEAPAGKPLRILIAEDSCDNRLLLQAYLAGSDHVPAFVEEGRAAVEAFGRGGRFDLILMDMNMPVMDGLTATNRIRRTEAELGLDPVPIVALTANALSRHVQMSHDAGCTAHLSKPVSKQRLLRAIEEYGRRSPGLPAAAIHIAAPPGIADLAPGYIARRKAEVGEMLSLLAAPDFARLARLAHDLKGTGGAYGFPELTSQGAAIEEAARQSDREALALRIGQLADYLSRIRIVEAEAVLSPH